MRGGGVTVAQFMFELIEQNQHRIDAVWHNLDAFFGGHAIETVVEYRARVRAILPCGEGAVIAWDAGDGHWWLDTWNESGRFPGLHQLRAFTRVCFLLGATTLNAYTGKRTCGLYRREGWTEVEPDHWAVRMHILEETYG